MAERDWRVGWHVITGHITWYHFYNEEEATEYYDNVSNSIVADKKNVWLQRRGADDHWLPVKGPVNE